MGQVSYHYVVRVVSQAMRVLVIHGVAAEIKESAPRDTRQRVDEDGNGDGDGDHDGNGDVGPPSSGDGA